MENIADSSQPAIRKFGDDMPAQMKKAKFFVLVALAVLIGVGAGFLPKLLTKSSSSGSSTTDAAKTAGIVDQKTL